MKRYLFALWAALSPLALFAQEAPTSALFRALQKGDSIVFDEGFNKCNLAALDKITAASLIFLHDQGGTQNKAEFMAAMQKNICGNPAQKPIRKLTPGSLVVYPLKKDGILYGAIQMGDHEFYIAEAGKPLRPTSTAKFITTWILTDGVWMLSICHSYHHVPVK
jgi:hypothetical protein